MSSVQRLLTIWKKQSLYQVKCYILATFRIFNLITFDSSID